MFSERERRTIFTAMTTHMFCASAFQTAERYRKPLVPSVFLKMELLSQQRWPRHREAPPPLTSFVDTARCHVKTSRPSSEQIWAGPFFQLSVPFLDKGLVSFPPDSGLVRLCWECNLKPVSLTATPPNSRE